MIISERRSVVPEVLLVLQHNAAEYGAICLAMVLGFHGAHAPLDELRIEGPLLYRGIRQRQFCASSPLGVGSGLAIG